MSPRTILSRFTAFFTSASLAGCGAATGWIIQDVTGSLVGAAAGAATEVAISSIADAKIRVSETAMEKVLVDSSAQYQTVKITGKVEYLPAKVSGAEFGDFSRVLFVFELLDKKEKVVANVTKTLTLQGDALIESLEANKPYEFVVEDPAVPTNRWQRVTGHRFKQVIEQLY